jgi:hypothetical protein
MISIKTVLVILSGIILLYVVLNVFYNSKSPSITTDRSGYCKFTEWSDCDCETQKRTREFLEGNPSKCNIPSLLSTSCITDKLKCCQYSDWDSCDCNYYKQNRKLTKGLKSYCGTDLSRNCSNDIKKRDCCQYSEWEDCNCVTKKIKRSLIKGETSFCTESLEKNCNQAEFQKKCCAYNINGIWEANGECDPLIGQWYSSLRDGIPVLLNISYIGNSGPVFDFQRSYYGNGYLLYKGEAVDRKNKNMDINLYVDPSELNVLVEFFYPYEEIKSIGKIYIINNIGVSIGRTITSQYLTRKID